MNKPTDTGLLESASQLARSGQQDLALEQLKRLLDSDTVSSHEAHLLMAQLQETQHGTKEALRTIESGLQRFPGQFDLLLLKARVLNGLSDHVTARTIYQDLTERFPKRPAAWLGLMALNNQQNMFARTISLSEQVLQQFPRNLNARLLTARALTRLQRYAAAVACYEHILTNHPDCLQAHLSLSRIHSTLDDHTAAKKAVSEALALQPNHPGSIRQFVAVCRQTGESEQAIDWLHKRIDEGHMTGLDLLLELLCQQQQTDRFNSVLNSGRAYLKKQPELMFALGMRLRNAGHLSQAMQVFSQLTVHKGTDFDALKTAWNAHQQQRLLLNMKPGHEPDAKWPVGQADFDHNPQLNALASQAEQDMEPAQRRQTLVRSEHTLSPEEHQFYDTLVHHANQLCAIRKRFASAWLNTDIEPTQANALCRLVTSKIASKTAFSIIRLGDGEGIFLDYPKHQQVHQQRDRAVIQQRWWGAEKITSEWPDISRQLKAAIAGADVLGIPNLTRMIKSCSLNGSKKSPHHRGLDAILNHLLNNDVNHSQHVVTSCHLQNDWQFWNLYDQLLSGLEQITMITCHADIGPVMQQRFGIRQTRVIAIPPESFHAHKFDAPAGLNNHYPELFHHINQQLDFMPGEVCLVAAGFLGKLYCQTIKQTGGIAIDIGSMADLWMKHNTRKAHQHLQN